MSTAFEAVTDLGTARVRYEGEPVLVAGSRARFGIAFEAGFTLPAGAELGLARRWPSDWGTPQWSDPSSADFVAFVAAPGRQLRWWNARLHPWHPFDHILFVAFPEGLPAGERLWVRFGGAADDGPGFVVQTFIEETSPLLVRMRVASDQPWIDLARPEVRIVGAAAHRLVLSAPSQVSANVTFPLHLRIEDAWGNPARLDVDVRLDAPLSRSVRIAPEGHVRVDVAVASPGIHRLRAHVDGTPPLVSVANPIEVVDGSLDHRLCWGDLHAQSVIGCGARSIDAFYDHARDFAATDFASHQANCFLVSNPDWRETQASTRRAQDDGRFVTLLGVEWSAASAAGGDHNLYFGGDAAELHRCSHEFVVDKSDVASDLPHVDDLHRHYRGTDTIVAVHVGGRTADLRWHEPTLDRLLEVHSTHATSEWFLLEALRRGYRMGVIAGSDSVDGRPGASHPGHMGVRNVGGGLTAVALSSLTRSGLWSALKARHCYGTTGPRIILRLTAAAAQMGDELRVDRLPPFDVVVEGTAPLESITFFRDDAPLAMIDLMKAAAPLSNAVRIGWRGASAPGNWQRARMRWDGTLRIEGARIVAARPWAMDTPDEGPREVTPASLRWRSVTAGDWDGIVVELDDLARAALTFVSEPMTIASRLSDLGEAPRIFTAENPERTVELRRLPAVTPPMGWRGRFEDADPPLGAHAYWVRVRQADGALAWSTPIFTTLAS